MYADPLIEQYEKWSYPRPINDLTAYLAGGGRDFSDPGRLRRKIWPKAIEPANLKILVAGCGANQAAIIAKANPDAEVYAIDLSSQAIAHHERLQSAHQLDNLRIQRFAVEHVASLGKKYDYIVSTGVLHHLESPEAGLKALRDVLAPHGVISVMLYGKNRRAGVYMVQEALRTLRAERTIEGVELAKDVVKKLPAWHPAKHYTEIAPDLHYEAGFVDTFLNARDQAYTVPEIFELASACDLKFQCWLDALPYSASALFPSDAAIHDQIEQLQQSDQWHVVDLLAQMTATHRFLLCHSDRDARSYTLDFFNNDWLDYVPHLHPELEFTDVRLVRGWHSFNLTSDAVETISKINGIRTFRECIGVTHDRGQIEYYAAIFALLVEWDHIFCELP